MLSFREEKPKISPKCYEVPLLHFKCYEEYFLNAIFLLYHLFLNIFLLSIRPMRLALPQYLRWTPYFHVSHKGSLFSLPSLMNSKSFAQLVNNQGAVLQEMLRNDIIKAAPHLYSRAFCVDANEKSKALCSALTTMTRDEVEEAVMEKYGLKDERLVTCLVPYQLGVNLILSRLPLDIRKESIEELKREEEARRCSTAIPVNKWIQWKESDVYVSTGIKYLKRISSTKRPRIPVFAIMGHVNHGKTTLTDALQGSNILAEEPHHITQNVRAFTVPCPHRPNELFTFIDTPGHRIFVETRFHIELMTDYIILIVSVTDGIESQTHEVIKTALNVDKPIIVVLNKLDLLSDPLTAEKSVKRILSQLSHIGLEVTLLQKEEDAVTMEMVGASVSTQSERSLVTSDTSPYAEFFSPMKSIDPTYKGSKRHPTLHLKRRCYGVCVSAKRQIHIKLLWQLMRACRNNAPPLCYSNTAGYSEHNAAVQGVVLESSKHLFDEEGFRLNRLRQRLQKSVDLKQGYRERQLEKNSIATRVRANLDSAKKQATRHNRTSTTSLILNILVKEGVMTEGMHFVVDQAEGQIKYMMDYWGNRVHRALPGMAVTIVDTDSMSGVPGAGISVLSTTDISQRLAIHAYRQMLQWYVECFTSKLHFLRPRGMDTSFGHLGDYGQLNITDSLEYQLLYGPPPDSPERTASPEALPPGAAPEYQTIGGYLAEKNQTLSEAALEEVSCASVALPVGVKRMGQAIVKKDDELILESTWDSFRLKRGFASQEEYEQYVSQCVQVGVLLKVDSWHTARMLCREIPRLGTRRVAFQIVGVRFGPLHQNDILFFGQAVKVIVCYRTPIGVSNELDFHIESNDSWVLQTDHFADIVLFMKWCAIATHKAKAAGTDFGDDDSSNNHHRPTMVVEKKEDAGNTVKLDALPKRTSKLLVYSGGDSEVTCG